MRTTIEIVVLALVLVFLVAAISLYRRAVAATKAREVAESDLRENEEKYRLLFEKSDDPMWVIYDQVFMTANQAAATMLGYDSVAELKAVHPSQLSPEYQPNGETSYVKANRMMSEAYEKGYHRFEWDHQRKNGEVFPVEVTLTRIPFEGRDALYCVWRDITEAKDAQIALEVARHDAELANTAKSEFLAQMSHELRTPLNAILGFSQMLSAETFGKHSNQRYVDYSNDIQLSGEHLLAIINDVLDLSKIEAGEMDVQLESFNLHDAVVECVKLINIKHPNRPERITMKFGDGTETLTADPKMFRQTLLNLLSNSDKYTPPEKHIYVETGTEIDGGVTITVRDEGMGIEPEDMKKILQPFGQARTDATITHEGTGLGLPIANKLMELQGGTLEISSVPGESTSVSLHFPVIPDEGDLFAWKA